LGLHLWLVILDLVVGTLVWFIIFCIGCLCVGFVVGFVYGDSQRLLPDIIRRKRRHGYQKCQEILSLHLTQILIFLEISSLVGCLAQYLVFLRCFSSAL